MLKPIRFIMRSKLATAALLANGILASGTIITSVAIMASSAVQANEMTQTQQLFERQIQALMSSDYQQFTDQATPEFKKALAESRFNMLTKTYGKKLTGGYQVEYQGVTEQKGYDVYSWKISYFQGGASNQYRMVLEGETLAGFWIQ